MVDNINNMNRVTQICRECKHMLEIHYEDGQCGKVNFTEPTKEEKHYMPDFNGSYEFCECTGYKP